MTAALTFTEPPRTASVAGLYRHLWRYAQGARLQLVAAMTLLVTSQVIKLLVPWLAAQAINALQSGQPGALAAAARAVALILLTYAATWALHGPGRILERSVGVRVRQGLTDALYDKLTQAPLAWHDRHHSGEMQHRVGQASQALYGFAQNQFIYLQAVVNFVGPIVALWLLSADTGALAILGYLVVAVVILRFDGALMRLAERENQAERRYSTGLIDFLGNIATVIGLRLQAGTRRLLRRRLDAVFVPLKRSIMLNELKWCVVDLLGISLTWGLVAAYVWHDIGSGAALLIGSVFMVYQYAQQAGGVIGAMAAHFQGFARTRTDFASANPIWHAPVSVALPPIDGRWQRIDLHEIGFDHAVDDALPADACSDDAGTGTGASTARGGLHHIDLSLKRGERIALVGPSGAGKSSLLRVLAGLYEPQRGHFAIDGVSQLSRRALSTVATLIPQEAHVFEATVAENLSLDTPHTEAELAAALAASAFDAVLATLPQGLQTPISERGGNLSGGQRQRLCLARGLLAAGGSSLLLLDEPTSALDAVTEACVHQRLQAQFADACIVASVHRMSLLDLFDTVVLMQAGRVLDTGTAAELRQRQPLFRELLREDAQSQPPSAPIAA